MIIYYDKLFWLGKFLFLVKICIWFVLFLIESDYLIFDTYSICQEFIFRSHMFSYGDALPGN